jgi:hypothetical protein
MADRSTSSTWTAKCPNYANEHPNSLAGELTPPPPSVISAEDCYLFISKFGILNRVGRWTSGSCGVPLKQRSTQHALE